MNTRTVVLLSAFAMLVSSCTNLGIGEADCASPERRISGANILNVQAVPTARFTPCLEERPLGWDSVEWFAEKGESGFEIARAARVFLTVKVTELCDVSGAVQVFSGSSEIERYENVEYEPAEIEIMLVPSASGPMVTSMRLAERFADVNLDDRPVVFTINHNMDQPISARIDEALERVQYVWIIDELDADEGTVDLRSNNPGATGRGIDPVDALDLIEDAAPDVFYRGNWFFSFDGGCITYEFDAEGDLAETVAAEAEESIGFYPAHEVVQFAKDNGYQLVE